MLMPEVTRQLRSSRDVQGWLSPGDAYLIGLVDHIQTLAGVQGNLFEIGAHHGKSALLLAQMRRHDSEVLGVCDIFSNPECNVDSSGRGNHEAFLAHFRKRFSDLSFLRIFDMPSGHLTADDTTDTCRIFHIDGGHTPEITKSDLLTADRAILPQGVVILDDLFNAEWPGVAEGFFNFTREYPDRLTPLAIGPNKIVLAPPATAPLYTGYWKDLKVLASHIPSGPFYFKTTFFLGCPVLAFCRHASVDITPTRAAFLHLGFVDSSHDRPFLSRVGRFTPWRLRRWLLMLAEADPYQ